MIAVAHRRTPDFDETTLPDALRKAHSTRDAVWGLLVVSEGAVRLVFEAEGREPGSVIVRPGHPAVIPPTEPHHVETDGPMRMHLEFHTKPPLSGGA